MSDEFKDFTVTPTLTFDAPQEAAPVVEIKKEEPVEPQLDESVLSDAERKMVDDFSKQIDIRNSAAILQYGAGTQKKMADFSEEALEKVKTKDLGEVGDLLGDVVTQLKSFDAAEEEKGLRSTDLPQLMEKAQRSGLPEDAQAAKDLDSMCQRFEKKIHDLELTRMISIQTAPQIRLVQGNDTLMAEKIQSTLVNTIPLWKSQMVLALGVAHSSEAARAQRQVTDMTNALLQKNAETLKMATIEAAKESERGIVDIETLKKTNESLISTFDEIMNIQKEGHQKRMEAEVEMNRLEGELKNKLLEINR